jgi:ABC-type nitrate/sulfonate/bicarbonate transport system substrate-binding protein
MRPLRPLLLLLLLVAAAGIAGCGGDDDAGGNRPATLILDFTPNAVHSGIFLAHSRGYDEDEGVPLTIRQPSSSTESVRLLLAGKADFAVLDIHDLALARAEGRDVVGVMALVQTPLAAVIAKRSIESPKALEGKRVGVTGLPSDDAVLRSIVIGGGGRADSVNKVTIGFNAVAALAGGRVDAVTAFWNVEGLALQKRVAAGVREFRVERFGAPSYPELVLCVARTTLQDSPGLVKSVVAALRRGYEETLADPEAATEALLHADKSLDRATVKDQLDAISPAFTAHVSRFGDLSRSRLQAWGRWEREFGIVKKPVDADQAFSFGY